MVAAAAQLLTAGGNVNESRGLIGLPKSAFDGADLDTPQIANTVKAVQDPVDPLELAKARTPVIAPGAPGAPPGKNPAANALVSGDPPAKKARARKSGRFRTTRNSIAA
jgi:hypothetical protein